MYIADFLSRSAPVSTREQNSHPNDNSSFVLLTNDHDKVCDLFENVNLSEDLAVTTKRYNQIQSCTAIYEALQVLKATVLNGCPELKYDFLS